MDPDSPKYGTGIVWGKGGMKGTFQRDAYEIPSCISTGYLLPL